MDGRTALITGSSLGLGLAMGHRFAESGANVALVGRRADVAKQAEEAVRKSAGGNGGKVASFACDVASAEGVKELHKAVVDALGPVDILVNNAGTSQTGKFDDITDEVWQSDLDLKLFAAIRLCRLVMPGMRERKWGRIINVLNLGAKAPQAGGAPTAVSRATGMALTKVLSKEGAPHNVLVNGLLVGTIESDQQLNRYLATDRNMTYQEYQDGRAREIGIPLGRLGRAEEFANIATFLCSEEGSYITGCAINVDGGMSPVV